MSLRFDNRVAVITGAGGGIGRSYALYLASLGANVLVNDLSNENASKVVKEIADKGYPLAVVNNDSATEGSKIIEQAMKQWGRIDILINNAGVLRDKSFKGMSEADWDLVHQVHIKGAYSCTKAAWPIFRKQKYGRIINTASAAGLYGNFGQVNYSSCKMALTTFSKSLSIEGAKYNIKANTIAPIAASNMTATIMPPDMLENLKPEKIAPAVAYLCHESCTDAGTITEAGAGWYGKIRWERSKGAVFKPDDNFSPWIVKQRFAEITDFKDADHPAGMADTDIMGLMEKAKNAPANPKVADVNLKGQVVIVTGAGAGLGRAHAMTFAKYGASVLVNDVSAENANKVVQEIKQAGGSAAANTSNVVSDGEAIVKAAVDAFGGLHAIINNAGILRDKSFTAMTDKEWNDVEAVHFKGAFRLTKAAWPIFQKQKYGRIVNTTSPVGLHGNFGQMNYSTYKGALIGFTKSLAIEGKKYNIFANVIAPNAGTAMTATIWPEELVKAFKPEYVSPIVTYLASPANESVSKGIFEASGGWFAAYRWQRSPGFAFPIDKNITVEDILSKWSAIGDYSKNTINPDTAAESQEPMFANFQNKSSSSSSSSFADFTDSKDSELAAKAKKENQIQGEYSYSEKDVILYNLGVGATEKELKYTFEGNDNFQAIPTFGVVPQFGTAMELPMTWLPNFVPNMVLHGEQYLVINQNPIPTSGTMVNYAQIGEVLDKGKAAAVKVVIKTFNKDTGDLVFENHMTTFVRGSGGFGGRTTSEDWGNSTAANPTPKRNPDHVVELKLDEKQAAVYRLSGDYNPLHIDPEFAKVGGFDKPILHGLCSFGVSGKAINDTFGAVKDIKARFAGVAFPGETLVTSLWKEGNKVYFQTAVKERGGKVILSNAAATLA